MSYDGVWGISFKELRKAGFRPLTDQAWAGVRTVSEFNGVKERAAKIGLNVIVPVQRWEVRGRFQYTCDLSMLHGRSIGYRWTFVPFTDFTEAEGRDPPWANCKTVDPNRRFGYAIFRNETDAVLWKLLVT